MTKLVFSEWLVGCAAPYDRPLRDVVCLVIHVRSKERVQSKRKPLPTNPKHDPNHNYNPTS